MEFSHLVNEGHGVQEVVNAAGTAQMGHECHQGSFVIHRIDGLDSRKHFWSLSAGHELGTQGRDERIGTAGDFAKG